MGLTKVVPDALVDRISRAMARRMAERTSVMVNPSPFG